MKLTEPPILVEQTFNTSIENVWRAITDHDEMKQWFFPQLESFKAEVGFETQFLVENEGRQFTHLWKITEVVPNQKITCNWQFEEYEGDSFVTMELSNDNDATKLKLTAEVVKAFPSDIPEFKRESGVNGWNYFIKESLKKYLDSK